MKSVGIVRKLDSLGRIVLPIELRKTLEITEKDGIEIFTEGQSIILKKYAPNCVFCSGKKDIKTFKGKSVCEKCIEQLSK
ncbi:MAG: AbrB/MazE/SpoVT family DNA-binding domain-containing protein [Clostridia bacterium]|nr:AbrB/MazE/SpoVT family DNA-binding domain-containing protein [Clostridia bacterium]